MAADTPPRDDFKQKLFLSIIDKLVFGLLIILAGFVLNWVLESHRADQAVKTEIARVRVDKVAEVWKALDAHQQAVMRLEKDRIERFSDKILQIMETDEGKFVPRGILVDPYDALKAKRAKLSALLRTNRFWLGERLYPTYLAYAARQRSLQQAYDAFELDLFQVIAPFANKTDLFHFIHLSRSLRRGKRHYTGIYVGPGRYNAQLEKWWRTTERGRQHVRESRRELNQSRVDVFSAMERLS